MCQKGIDHIADTHPVYWFCSCRAERDMGKVFTQCFQARNIHIAGAGSL